MKINKKVEEIIIGASYDSVLWAYENNATIVYDEIEYYSIIDFEKKDELDSKLQLLAISGRVFHLSHPTVEIVPEESKIIMTESGRTVELKYNKLVLHDDSVVSNVILDSTYENQTYRYEIVYNFLVSLGRFHLKGQEFDFENFGFTGDMSIHRKDNGKVFDTLWPKVLVEDDRYKIVDNGSDGFKIVDATGINIDIVVFNEELWKLKYWEETRLGKLIRNREQKKVRSLRNIREKFGNIYVEFNGDRVSPKIKKTIEETIEPMIISRPKRRKVELTEKTRITHRKVKVSNGLKEMSEKYDNIEVM